MWCTGTQPAPPVPALSLAWPGPGSVSQGGTPASPPRRSSLLPCPGVGTFAKQSPPWAFLVGLTGLSKALCAERLPVTPAGRIALSGSYFKANHLGLIPIVNPGVWLLGLLGITSAPIPSFPELAWSPRHPQVLDSGVGVYRVPKRGLPGLRHSVLEAETTASLPHTRLHCSMLSMGSKVRLT